MSNTDQQLSRALSHIGYNEELHAHVGGFCRRALGHKHPPEKGVLVATNRRLYFSFYKKNSIPLSFPYDHISAVEVGSKFAGQTLNFVSDGVTVYLTLIEKTADLKHLLKLLQEPSDPFMTTPRTAHSDRPVREFIARTAQEPYTPSLSKPLLSPTSPPQTLAIMEGDLAHKLKELSHLQSIGALTAEEHATYKAQLLKKFLE